MRFHITMPHSDAFKAYEAAAELANAEFDKDLGRNPDYPPLQTAETAALKTFMVDTPAVTPTELAQKIKAYHDREMYMWITGQEYLEAILTDCARMQGWPLSPRFLERWIAWRKLDEVLQSDLSPADEKFHSDLRAQAYCEIAMADCTTPGDFILKQYLRLHTTNGSTLYGEAKEDRTGNPWDIDIDDHSDEARFETADKLGCYDDINHTDVGMNLLAYGLLYFDAEAWMKAANRTGLKVDLCIQRDGREGVSISMLNRNHLGIQEDNDDTPQTPVSPRIKRERDRLRRILANVCEQRAPGGGRDRYRAIGDEIRENWPELVWRAPAIVPADRLADHLAEQEQAA